MIRRVLLSVTTLLLLQPFIVGSIPVNAQDHGILITVDPFSNGVVEGDPAATFEQAVNTFLSGRPELPYKEWYFECYEFVGYYFTMTYTDRNGNTQEFERVTGTIGDHQLNFEDCYFEETTTEWEEDFEGDMEQVEVVIGTYLFKANGYANCSEPTLTIRSEQERIETGESTLITVDLMCGGTAMANDDVTLSLDGVGELDQTELYLDSVGHGEATFHGTERGRATITASMMNCEQWDGESREFTSSCVVRVGEPGVEIDLTYDASSTMMMLNGVFLIINHISVPLEVEHSSGEVTGTGTVETEIQFDYSSEECHVENFEYSGFEECFVEGTYIDGEYLFTITITGYVSYEHVCDLGPMGEMRIPIEAPILWEQYFAEPIRLSDDHDETFETSGSIMGVADYTISAQWEE